jgi:50S ribosomal subunit-associated GTPase HflX
VLEVLASLGANAPVITVYNKIDLEKNYLPPVYKDTVRVSAVTGEGIEELEDMIEEKLFSVNR